MKRWRLVLTALLAAPVSGEPLHHDAEAIRKAREGVEQEIPVARADPTRPAYHFLPAARWVNDPNGCFFAAGWFHVFYQLNPYGNDWGHIHWGHARSRDNVTWEHLPVAIWPDTAKGEHHCGSGSAVQDGEGNWQMWYTSISGRGKDFSVPARFNGQVLVKPLDKDFIQWGKATDDPVNRPTLTGNSNGYGWNHWLRDSTFFKTGGRTFMALGITGSGEVGGNSPPIYEAQDKALTKWTYRGRMFNQGWDCPQMIPFGEQWLYVMTWDTPPQWFLGAFDPATARFTSERGGRLDQSKEYMTISFATDDQGRHIVYCWIHPTKQARGWNNCFALPRVLTLGTDGQPVQAPVPELAKLRGEHVGVKNLAGAKVLDIKGDTLEIAAVFEKLEQGNSGLKVRRSDDGSRALDIRVTPGGVDVFGTHLPARPEGANQAIRIHVFLDKSVIEVFVNGGRQTVSRVMYPPLEDLGVEAFSAGSATVDVWRMRSIW